MKWLVDANIFLSIYQRDYPPSVFPSLWTHFSSLVTSGKLLTLDKGRNEILPYKDESLDFFEATIPASSVLDSNTFLTEYAATIAWAETKNTHYKRSALDDFASNSAADAWLVAAGLNLGYSILTQETSEPENKKRVKIPDACLAQDVDFCNFIDFLKATGYQG